MPNLTPAHDTQHSVWHIRLNNSFGHTTWSVTNMTHKTELDMLNTQAHDVPCLGLHGTWHVAHTTQHVASKTTKPCDMHNTTHHVMTHMASDTPDTSRSTHIFGLSWWPRTNGKHFIWKKSDKIVSYPWNRDCRQYLLIILFCSTQVATSGLLSGHSGGLRFLSEAFATFFFTTCFFPCS